MAEILPDEQLHALIALGEKTSNRPWSLRLDHVLREDDHDHIDDADGNEVAFVECGLNDDIDAQFLVASANISVPLARAVLTMRVNVETLQAEVAAQTARGDLHAETNDVLRKALGVLGVDVATGDVVREANRLNEKIDALEAEGIRLRSTAAQLTNHQRALAEAKKDIDRCRCALKLSEQARERDWRESDRLRSELAETRFDCDARIQQIEDAMRLDHEEGCAETDKMLSVHGYDSLRFADTRHGWIFSTRRCQEILSGPRVRFSEHAGVAQKAAAEEEGARASTPSAGHAEHRGGSGSLTTKDAGSSPAPSSIHAQPSAENPSPYTRGSIGDACEEIADLRATNVRLAEALRELVDLIDKEGPSAQGWEPIGDALDRARAALQPAPDAQQGGNGG